MSTFTALKRVETAPGGLLLPDGYGLHMTLFTTHSFCILKVITQVQNKDLLKRVISEASGVSELLSQCERVMS